MKNHWIEFFTGIVTVKATGKGLERFLNNLLRKKVAVWSVKKHGPHSITFQMGLKSISKFREVVRGSGIKIEFQRGAGAPFLYKRILKNSGFALGVFLFFGLILTLSNMVWGIEIKGANPATEYQIRKQLDKMDIKIGEFQFFSKELDEIQAGLTNNIDAITWIGVELKGTTYHFQVVEKNEPEKMEEEKPQNLIAAKKATIVDYFIEEGDQVFTIHDVVKKGQLLVTGIYGKDKNTKTVSARGEIWGETWYNSKVTIPLDSTFQVFNGNEKQKHYLKLFGYEIPVWGFGKVEYKEYEKEENEKNVKFLKWELPLKVTNKTYREKEEVTRSYTEEEAIKAGKEKARKDIQQKIGEDGKIKKEKILRQSVKNGKVILNIDFTTIENIAEVQPITQGDLE
ncbi:sporulation protein YqfD [Niallia taxi]|uniref:sporulation protein YqfD n=1 Tax=Niallia taxi TaxID=2499688 RepID=UPI0023A9FD57|nr:sporulation protein YqfD [Niallia taxi]MDE5052212.1 sporulation protein YqfD [Niallia taxi]WOD64296.1 sporulation protein YqfD [Niallia taxi]